MTNPRPKLTSCLCQFTDKGFNCAETTLQTVNLAWNLTLNQPAFDLMKGFGGGMAVGDLCGVVAGAVAGLSRLYALNYPNQKAELRLAVQNFVSSVKSKLGSCKCCDLKPQFYSNETKCNHTIFTILSILDQIYESTLQ